MDKTSIAMNEYIRRVAGRLPVREEAAPAGEMRPATHAGAGAGTVKSVRRFDMNAFIRKAAGR